MIDALNNSDCFRAPGTFEDLHRLVHGYLGEGNKMGEGWLLTAEMLELIHSGHPQHRLHPALRLPAQPHCGQGHDAPA